MFELTLARFEETRLRRSESVKRLCAFCGSSPGTDPVYVEAARALGRCLAHAGHGLVYGGGRRGMMGAIADAVLEAGGEAIGVVPADLFGSEHVHPGLSELRQVVSMAERKAVMTELCNGFVTLPGGLGTLDELFEMWAYRQLGLQPHPLGLLNTAGYYDQLIAFLDHTVAQGYVDSVYRNMLVVENDPTQLVGRLLG